MTRGCQWTGVLVHGSGRMCCVSKSCFWGRKRRKGVVSGRRKRASSLQESEVVLLLHMMLKGFLVNPSIIDGIYLCELKET